MAFSQKATIPRCYGKQLSKTVLHHGCFCLSFGNHHIKYLELFCFSKSETVAQTCSERKQKLLLSILQTSRENTCMESLHLQNWHLYTLGFKFWW